MTVTSEVKKKKGKNEKQLKGMVIVYHQEGSRKILVMLQWNRPATPPRLCIILMPPPLTDSQFLCTPLMLC